VLALVEGLTMDVTRMTSPYQLSLSVARLLDPATTSDGMLALLGNLDVFAIWGCVLTAIGLMHVAKLDRTKAIVATVAMFAVACIPGVLALARGG